VPNADGGKNNTRDEKIRPDSNENHEDKTAENAKQQEASNAATTQQISTSMGKSPGEVAFFKLLHSEFKKATHFFDRATEEHAIREERVREGMEIMRKPNSIMVNEKWALMAKSIYRLYKDLLLLETFAIMTYCSFSKILKKHDKVTGYETKNAFMANIVNKANFTHYPKVLGMITRCEKFYEEVSANLLKEGKEGLYEDERTSAIVTSIILHLFLTLIETYQILCAMLQLYSCISLFFNMFSMLLDKSTCRSIHQYDS